MQYEPLTEAVDIIDDHFEAAITKQSGLSSLTEIDKSDQIDVKAAADMMTGRISACKINAAVARKLCPTNHSLYQFWCLLSVVIEVCGIGDTESLINWSSSALGSSLLYRLVNFIREIADLQTFATMICVLGGTNVLLDLLKQYYFDKPGLIRKVRIGKTDESIDPSQLMIQAEEYLYSYSELLYRWGEPLLALEVGI